MSEKLTIDLPDCTALEAMTSFATYAQNITRQQRLAVQQLMMRASALERQLAEKDELIAQLESELERQSVIIDSLEDDLADLAPSDDEEPEEEDDESAAEAAASRAALERSQAEYDRMKAAGEIGPAQGRDS